MACSNCGEPDTIKAHLIPKVFCQQIQDGTSHAAQVTESGEFRKSQSGLWDRTILCAECDNRLGELENYAHQVFAAVRDQGSEVPWKGKRIDGADNKKILRFCAAILYKYSLTDDAKGQIDLGFYKEVCRSVAFGETGIHSDLDAFFWRPLRFPYDSGQFIYRAPFLAHSQTVDLYRMMMGGMLIFVKLDKSEAPELGTRKFMIKGKESFVYLTVPAQGLEEYETTKRIIEENKYLSDYLGRMENQSTK